ncbi:MAG: chorismate mutase [Elusimicrobiales bacterium]|nr:chorismate mutase [Elusimicrobiales bacterium]
MDKLSAARLKIDSLDRRLAALLARRFELAVPLRGLKKKLTDRAREKRVLANAAAAAGKLYAPSARAVFTEIIRQSKKLQGGK